MCAGTLLQIILLALLSTNPAAETAPAPTGSGLIERPLPIIESLYQERFGKERPAEVLSIEEKIKRDAANKARSRSG